MKTFGSKIFKYRSYTPIPFLIVMLLFQEATITSLVIGFTISLIGEGWRFWGVSVAGSETRTTGSVGGTYLIITGAFSHVRNPLYVGNILLYVGIGIMSMSLFPFLQIIALLFFIWQYHVIISEEEGYLRKAFGEQYDDYTKNVPRLLPQIKAYKNKDVVQPPLDIKAGLKSEKRTLQAFTLVTLILVALYLFA